MKQFHDLEFDIPNNYSFVDKDNYLEFRKASIGRIDSWLIPPWQEFIIDGSFGLIFNPENVEMHKDDEGSYATIKEHIILNYGNHAYPTISEEEYLANFKTMQNMQPNSELLKCEISTIAPLSKYSIYEEKKLKSFNTYSLHFFTSKESNKGCVVTLYSYLHNDAVELSKENFNKILNSIEIK